jgi:uncharacterized protein YecE (DUF72 family)
LGLFLVEYLVGTGGWGYFRVANKPSLQSYSEVFNFVEINYTFYKYPNPVNLKRWRRTVPSDFVFSVRCHQDLTHNIGLKPVEEAFEVFYKMKIYCKILESPYLVFETPASYIFTHKDISAARDFFSSVSLSGLRLVWEYRAPFDREVAGLMEDFNIVQSIDLSSQTPPFSSDLVYSRIFGKGKHNLYQFTDDELLEIQINANTSNANKIILAFHGSRMNTDAARFKVHRLTGKFLPVTNFLGVDSAKSVLTEDATFPSSKLRLIEDQGWKVIDLSETQRVRLSEVLERIPDKNYSSLDDVIVELKAVL